MIIETKSHYEQSYPFAWKKFTGADFSRTAFIFPGQGAAVPGMFQNELKRIPEFKEAFSQADEFAISKKLPKVSDYLLGTFELSGDVLPYIRNLALFCVEVAAFRALIKKGIRPMVLTGHSFGEYAVICSAGIVSFSQMLEIIYRRDLYSPPLNSIGTMIAISCSHEEFQALSPTFEFAYANINSPRQIVISVKTSEFKKANEFLKLRRLAARALESVGRPYHSPWMEETKDAFVRWLQTFEYQVNASQYEILSSVNCITYDTKTNWTRESLNFILAEQLTAPVNFIQQSQRLQTLGIHTFLELGVTNIYTGFIKSNLGMDDTQTHVAGAFLGSPHSRSDVQAPFELDVNKSSFNKVVSKYISDITGYSLTDISVFDNFQEDLQIDSIKKAEIIFRSLEESNLYLEDGISISQMQRVGDVVQYLEKLNSLGSKRFSEKKSAESQFFIMHTALQRIDEASGRDLVRLANPSMQLEVKIDAKYRHIPIREFLNRIDATPKILILNVAEGLAEFNDVRWIAEFMIYFAAELSHHVAGKNQLKVVLSSTKESAFFLGIVAFFKSLAKENGHFSTISLLHPVEYFPSPQSQGALVPYPDGDYVVREHQLFKKHFTLVPRAEGNISGIRIFSIGGGKGILEKVYSRFPITLKAHLFIVGRTDVNDKQIQKCINKLRKRFVSVDYMKADAMDLAALEEAGRSAMASMGRIDCIVNSAGQEVSQKLSLRTGEGICAELNSKIQPFMNALRLQRQFECRLINFSSVVAAFGNEGQGGYCFANAYLSGQPNLQNVDHIHWPAMDRMGMTENLGVLQKLKSTGISLMNARQASEFFLEVLRRPSAQENYYFLDPKDILLFQFPLKDYDSLLPAVGHLARPSEMIFKKTISLMNDSYIQDHKIESTFVMPAAMGIAAFACLGKLYFDGNLQMDQFLIKNMIVVSERDYQTFIGCEWPDSKLMRLKMFSNVDHYCAQVQELSPANLNRASETTLQFFESNFTADRRVDLDSFYSIRSIDYGPKFQMIKNAYIDKHDQVLVFGRTDIPYLTGNPLVDLIATFVELSFHAIYLKGILLYKGLGVPVAVGQIRIFREVNPSSMKVLVEINTAKSKRGATIWGSAKVYDERNVCIFAIDDVEMSIIRNYESVPFDLVPGDWQFHG